MNASDITFAIAMSGVALWLLFLIVDVARQVYNAYIYHRLLRQERAFLRRWYATEGDKHEIHHP